MNICIVTSLDGFFIVNDRDDCVGKIIINPLMDKSVREETKLLIEAKFKTE
jgi:hypothetical protein